MDIFDDMRKFSDEHNPVMCPRCDGRLLWFKDKKLERGFECEKCGFRVYYTSKHNIQMNNAIGYGFIIAAVAFIIGLLLGRI